LYLIYKHSGEKAMEENTCREMFEESQHGVNVLL